jgi:hypothetical protein
MGVEKGSIVIKLGPNLVDYYHRVIDLQMYLVQIKMLVVVSNYSIIIVE